MADTTDEQLLDFFVQQLIAYSKTAENQGVGIVVVKDNQILFMKGYGWRDRARELPFDEDTLFAIGSCTKAMTGFVLAMAEQNGLLRLDEPLIEHNLPEFRLKGVDFYSRINTIDLLSHSTGMAGYAPVAWTGRYTADEYYPRIFSLELAPDAETKFRNSFHYNNEMYTVAGELIERITGASWEDNIRSEIFDRLDMSASEFVSTPIAAHSNIAYPYLGGKRMSEQKAAAYAPAGAVRSNLHDLAKWLNLMATRGMDASGNQLVPVETMERLFDQHNVIATDGEDADYAGLGWIISERSGLRLIRHTGALDGYHADISFIPELRIGVAVLVNDHKAVMNGNIAAVIYRYLSAAYFSLAGNYLDTLFGLPYRQPTLTLADQDLYATRLATGAATSAYFAANPPSCVATYRHAGIGDFRLCQYNQYSLVNFGDNYWPLTLKSYDSATGTVTYEFSYLVANFYVTTELLFVPDASGSYTTMSTSLGGYAETGETVTSVFYLVQ